MSIIIAENGLTNKASKQNGKRVCCNFDQDQDKKNNIFKSDAYGFSLDIYEK